MRGQWRDGAKMTIMKTPEQQAAYDGLLRLATSLPEQLPNDADGFKALVVELQALRKGADDVLSKLPTAALGGEYVVGRCPQCEREQYQRPEGVRAVDTLGRNLQASLVSGCNCSWPG